MAKKADVEEVIAKYEGEWSIEGAVESVLEGDKGLVLKSKAKHHAISARLLKPFEFKNNKPLVMQYEVKFQNALECGGAYVKLLTDDSKLNLDQFFDKTPYTIMFGPDKCGTDSKLHFIIRYKNPVSGEYEEKHAKKTENIEPFFNDGRTHLYTLIVRPDNSYQLFIDQNELNSGNLLTDFQPPINPEKEIVDPNDKKPVDWDDRDKIPDPDATKPDDWDENEPKLIVDQNAVKPDGWLDNEPATIADPNAVKPDDWDIDTDGEWEAPKIDNPKCKEAVGCGVWEPPQIDNPKYKGKWRAPLIDNPNYKGKWEPRKIPNPVYFEDKDPFKSLSVISAIGLELWSMTDNIYFDNFLISDDENVANEFAKDSWSVKKTLETKNKGGDSVVDVLVNATSDKPWLWVVYALVAIVPIVLIVVFCCGKSSKPTAQASSESTQSNDASDAANRKKTDEPTQDDEVQANGADLDTDDNGANVENDVPEDNGEAEEQEDKEEEEEVVKSSKTKTTSKSGSNVSLEKSSGDAPANTPSPNTRKRRGRKE